MIPKKIHYCWLSGEPFPEKARKCMETWRTVMPDYEWKLWDKHTFDVDHSVPYVREAVAHRKWAFAADYIRLYALYTEGGIYLDTDVCVLKPFDDFLHHSFFTSMEYHPFMVERDHTLELLDKNGLRVADAYPSGIELQAAVMGAEPGHPFVKRILDWYEDKHFVRPDGTLGLDVIAPQIYARVAEDYGLRYVDADQPLRDGIMVYRSEVFAGNRREQTSASYAIHYCENSWNKLSLTKRVCHYSRFFCFLVKSKLRHIFSC